MKDFVKLINYFFSNYLSALASIASIVGLCIAVFVKADTALIGLIFIVLFLLVILIRFFFLIRRFLLNKTENGYLKFATYVRYSTSDCKHISYELHKYLQCKRPIMSEYEHDFHWSGSQLPKISSDIQEHKDFIKTPEGQYDKAIFSFKKPLLYNDFTIIHIKMKLDDEDQQSQTYCEQTIKEPLQLLSFRIELKYACKLPII